MQSTPEFRLGSGSAIVKLEDIKEVKPKEEQSDMADEVKQAKKNSSKAPLKLLILGGKSNLYIL